MQVFVAALYAPAIRPGPTISTTLARLSFIWALLEGFLGTSATLLALSCRFLEGHALAGHPFAVLRCKTMI
jgi:hypothetical protein